MPSCCKRRLFQYPFASFTAARSRFPSAPPPLTFSDCGNFKQAKRSRKQRGWRRSNGSTYWFCFAPQWVSFSLPFPSFCRTIKLKRAMPDADTQVKSSQGESAKIKLCKKEDTKWGRGRKSGKQRQQVKAQVKEQIRNEAEKWIPNRNRMKFFKQLQDRWMNRWLYR